MQSVDGPGGVGDGDAQDRRETPRQRIVRLSDKVLSGGLDELGRRLAGDAWQVAKRVAQHAKPEPQRPAELTEPTTPTVARTTSVVARFAGATQAGRPYNIVVSKEQRRRFFSGGPADYWVTVTGPDGADGFPLAGSAWNHSREERVSRETPQWAKFLSVILVVPTNGLSLFGFGWKPERVYGALRLTLSLVDEDRTTSIDDLWIPMSSAHDFEQKEKMIAELVAKSRP